MVVEEHAKAAVHLLVHVVLRTAASTLLASFSSVRFQNLSKLRATMAPLSLSHDEAAALASDGVPGGACADVHAVGVVVDGERQAGVVCSTEQAALVVVGEGGEVDVGAEHG